MRETGAAPAPTAVGATAGAETDAPSTPNAPTVRTEGPPVAGVDPPPVPALPVSAADTTAGTAAPPEWTVQAGDHLWHIAAVTLEQAHGRPVTDDEIAGYWRELIDANHDRLLAADNPDLIIPGQTFVLPAVTAAPTPDALP